MNNPPARENPGLFSGTPELARFESLPIGARFRLPVFIRFVQVPLTYVGGVYFKTGPESYGICGDEPEWQWSGDLPVETL